MGAAMIEHHVGTSRRSGVVHRFTKATARPTLKYYPLRGPVTKLMPLMEHSAGRIPRLSGTVHRPVQGRTWRGELGAPIGGPTAKGAILYLHGGAFLMCGLATHRRIVERLAQRTGMTVL